MRELRGIFVTALLFMALQAQAQQPVPSPRHDAQHSRTHDLKHSRTDVPSGEAPASGTEARLKVHGEAQAAQKSSVYEGAHLNLLHPTHNFGDVERKGGDLTHHFKVVNDGSAPLVITRVITSCSCLKASFPKRPVPAGDSAVIRITYEPHKSEPGVFHKVIQVYSNSVAGRSVITVQGNSLDAKKL